MEIKTVTYQCPNCNAALEYDNSLGKFRCFYCDGVFEERDIKNLFRDNEQMALDENEAKLSAEQTQDEEFAQQSALYSCPNCGAGVICDSLTASTRCHFCHTPVILSGRLSGDFKPDVIIPFSTTREQAESGFNKYIKGKFLLPKGFKENAKINSVLALYVPYWLKSGIFDAEMTAEGKKVTSWSSGSTRYVKTKVYNVERGMDLTFIRVPCDGSRRIDDSLMESIEPFNYSGLKPFSMSYLSGCAAEKYDVPKQEAAQRIDERVRQASEQLLRECAKEYGSLENVRIRVAPRRQTYVYALLPVWFLNYTYNGKDYAFAMNGQTGTMFGQLPVSGLKKFLFGAGIFLIPGAILMLAKLLGVIANAF